MGKVSVTHSFANDANEWGTRLPQVPSTSISILEEPSQVQHNFISAEAASKMRSGTTSSGRLKGSARWVGNDRDQWRYRLVRNQRTLRQCAGGRCWRCHMLRAAATLGSQGGGHRRRACCGCRSRRCIRDIGDRDYPWCLGVPSDDGPSYRSCQHSFEACRTVAASFPFALADGSSALACTTLCVFLYPQTKRRLGGLAHP